MRWYRSVIDLTKRGIDCEKNYFRMMTLKTPEHTATSFYAFRFGVDQNNNIIAVVIEPIPIKYWSED